MEALDVFLVLEENEIPAYYLEYTIIDVKHINNQIFNRRIGNKSGYATVGKRDEIDLLVDKLLKLEKEDLNSKLKDIHERYRAFNTLVVETDKALEVSETLLPCFLQQKRKKER